VLNPEFPDLIPRPLMARSPAATRSRTVTSGRPSPQVAWRRAAHPAREQAQDRGSAAGGPHPGQGTQPGQARPSVRRPVPVSTRSPATPGSAAPPASPGSAAPPATPRVSSAAGNPPGQQRRPGEHRPSPGACHRVRADLAVRGPDGGAGRGGDSSQAAALLRWFGIRDDIILEAFAWQQVETPDGPDFVSTL
jgi:hypothetical protein